MGWKRWIGTTANGRLKQAWNQGDHLSKWDWVLFGVLACFCYISFAQEDLYLTGNRSWMLYQSSFFDYYDVLHEWTGDYGANYMPSTFLLYAIWILPLKLLGFAPPPVVTQDRLIFTMWYKLLPVLFYIVSAYLIYRIAQELGLNTRRAKVCMFAFLTMPVALFSQFIFSQYDIFAVFFTLLGLYFYYRGQSSKDKWLFCLFFGIAVTFKYFALLIFFVLLLLDEKRVRMIIARSACMAMPFVLELLPFIHSHSFVKGVFGFNALSYANQADLITPQGSISFFQVACCFFVLWAYFVHPKDRDDQIRWSLYLSCGICFALFGLAAWHPQWLIFAAPFWVLSAFINRHLEKFLWIDFAFAVVFYPFVVSYWSGSVDQTLLRHGIWKYLLVERTDYLSMADLLSVIDANVLYAMLTVLILVLFVFKHPKQTLETLSDDNGRDHMWLIRLRLVTAVLLFAIPAFLCMFNTVTHTYASPSGTTPAEWVSVCEDKTYEQHLSGLEGRLEYIDLQLSTGGRENTCDLTMTVTDVTDGQVLAVVSADPERIQDGEAYRFRFSQVHWTESHEYCVSLTSDGTKENYFSVGIAPDPDSTDGNYASLYRIWDDVNICMTVCLNER